MSSAQVPCAACSWTTERQDSCGYQSNVKIFYAVGDRATWEVGSQRIVKDRSSHPPNSEAENLRFVRVNTTIPVPVVVDDWNDRGRHFLITERIPGTPLSEVWPSLSESDKDGYAKQTVEYLRQLRTLCSTRIQSINEQPVYSAFLFRDGYGIPHGPLTSDEHLWDEMAKGLKNAPQDLQDLLRRRMPSAQPYTFTHGDLTSKNIIVQNGSVTGVIDWESSGYFPAWWEFVSTAIVDSEDDRSWKERLREHMENWDEGLQFWRCYYNLSRWPSVDEKLLQWLQRPDEREQV
ncbi:hypothetical protein E5D57_009353 [Metarhizium anisopliae]|nr:hypothetical protein E5D57_009353 [Metarhizium anisopliae]